MTKIFKSFVRDESGATAIEYGLIAALLGVGIIAALTGVKNSLNTKFTAVSSAMDASSTLTK